MNKKTCTRQYSKISLTFFFLSLDFKIGKYPMLLIHFLALRILRKPQLFVFSQFNSVMANAWIERLSEEAFLPQCP